MNERIQQFANEAAKFSAIMALPTGESGDKLFVEKFAELIVEECAKAVENSIWHLPRGYKATDQADFLKKHFGVGE